MKTIEKYTDISEDEKLFFEKTGYVCVDTETTGLNYLENNLCTIQLFSEENSILIKFDETVTYNNLKALFYSDSVVKIFHNATFDVEFLMQNLEMDTFGKLVCTKIASKILHGLGHDNSLKSLLKEYLGIIISKEERLSDWSRAELSDNQIEYAINDVRYLYMLWNKLSQQLLDKGLEDVAIKSFEFVPVYKKLSDKGIDNIFVY